MWHMWQATSSNYQHAVELLWLLRYGLLACTTIPEECPESATESYILNGRQSVNLRKPMTCSPPQSQKNAQRHWRRVDLFKKLQEIKQHAFTLLGASPMVTTGLGKVSWQMTFDYFLNKTSDCLGCTLLCDVAMLSFIFSLSFSLSG